MATRCSSDCLAAISIRSSSLSTLENSSSGGATSIVVIGELDDDIARRPVERREELGDMAAGLDLDQLGQLAKHFVILRDLLVVATV